MQRGTGAGYFSAHGDLCVLGVCVIFFDNYSPRDSLVSTIPTVSWSA